MNQRRPDFLGISADDIGLIDLAPRLGVACWPVLGL